MNDPIEVTVATAADDLRRLAERLALAAGTQALTGRRSLGVGQPASHDTKSTVTDPVTEFDRAAEALIVGELRRLRPDDGIVGEEGADVAGTSGIDWHLDPIDGTTNFVYDLPMWCTSVAAVDAHGSIAGAVYAPALGEMFSAARGAGATLNGATDRRLRAHVARHGARRHRVQLPPRAPAGAGRPVGGDDPPRPRHPPLRIRRARPVPHGAAAGSTPTSKSTSTAGTSPPASLIAAEAGAVTTDLYGSAVSTSGCRRRRRRASTPRSSS